MEGSRLEHSASRGRASNRGRARHDREAWIERVAATDLPVLIRGESGTGKEHVARRIHGRSARAEGPFVAVNCAAIPSELLEAEMFGATRGAYTGSDRDRPGLFRRAHGGVLLLDEVGDMPAGLQAALLRTLQEGTVRPVGSSEEHTVDVRVVCATHRDLIGGIAAERFRADLYFRIAVLQIEIPPLRERLDEFDELIARLAPRIERETGERFDGLEPGARRRLEDYGWPGNIRELHATLAAATLRAGGFPIREEHLDTLQPRAAGHDDPGTEREWLRRHLAAHGDNLAAAARAIGWSRQRLYRRMQQHRLSRPRQRRP